MTPRPAPRPAPADVPAGGGAPAAPDWQRLLSAPPEARRRSLAGVVGVAAAVHLLGGWALLQVGEVREALRQAAPMVVDLIAPERPPEPPAPPPPTAVPRPPEPVAQAAPVMAAPSPQPPPPDSFTAPPTPAPAPAPVAPAAPVQAVAAPPAPAPPPSPVRRQVSATAVAYVVPPPAEVPRASRRAGEHGTVWLRVVVDTRGQPALVQVQRSSGYARLDEQALFAMRQARFQPYTENGTALEVEVVAPIEYPQE